MKPKWISIVLVALVSVAAYAASARPTPSASVSPGANGTHFSAAPVIYWSTEARRAIVPPGPGNIFGAENYGNKFPGEAAVYMGIVHAAIYDAAVAIEGGYQPYAITGGAPRDTSPAVAETR
jgi:hypothetical protein